MPEKTALRFEGADITYRAFARRIAAATRMLRSEFRVVRGDRVAFLGYNNPDFLVLIFACARLGAIMVPLNWRLAPPELLYILRNAGACVLFAEAGFADAVDSMRDGIAGCRIVDIDDAAADWEGFDEAFERAPAGSGGGPAGRSDDPVLIVYTSGTTGRPRGAVLTQNAMTFNAVNSSAAHDLTSADVVLTNLPMFHVGGLNIQTMPALHAGATVILQRRFEPDAAVSALIAERPSLTLLVPAQMQAVRGHRQWESIDFSCLRCLDTGSTTVPRPLLQAYLDRGIPVIQIYGSTETAPIAIHQRIADAWVSAGATGRPALHCEARICDGEGNELPDGERGEIVVRGPNVMTHYWDDPAATSEVLRDGWFHTGDIGHKDAAGNYHVDDRTKDVIISGSENIYPAELELVLDECPDIAESAVVGRADARWGEAPVACVVRRPGSAISADRILSLYDGRLARYKHPRDVVFLESLPRNVMGKVLKYELRETLRR